MDIRKIAKEEFDKVEAFKDNSYAWHVWKRAYDSAANNIKSEDEISRLKSLLISEKRKYFETNFIPPVAEQELQEYIVKHNLK